MFSFILGLSGLPATVSINEKRLPILRKYSIFVVMSTQEKEYFLIFRASCPLTSVIDSFLYKVRKKGIKSVLFICMYFNFAVRWKIFRKKDLLR